jgi:hypothetical protein
VVLLFGKQSRWRRLDLLDIASRAGFAEPPSLYQSELLATQEGQCEEDRLKEDQGLETSLKSVGEDVSCGGVEGGKVPPCVRAQKDKWRETALTSRTCRIVFA